MDFVETGIVVLNSKGSVYQKNKEAMNLLGLDVLTHVKQLSRISDELMTALEKAVPGDKLQIQFNTERGTVHLALRVSGIRIKDEELRIIALSDINRELDEREIDSWIRLTRRADTRNYELPDPGDFPQRNAAGSSRSRK